ncbi:MAG: hypothetical protein ACYC6G_12195 [Desulfobaccales bacterium]
MTARTFKQATDPEVRDTLMNPGVKPRFLDLPATGYLGDLNFKVVEELSKYGGAQ